MITPDEKAFFLERGYLRVEGVVVGDHLRRLQAAFEHLWAQVQQPKVSQLELLRSPEFRPLIEHPPILDRHRAIFGNQVQLLAYDLLRQGPHSQAAARYWHRDFSFPGERPLAINTLLFLDDITLAQGPTRVVPGTHRGEAGPPRERIREPLAGEVAVEVPAGSAIFINAALWHTGGRNDSDGLRRGVYLYYGYWWLKRYEADRALSWQAYEGASPQRLTLLGVRMPGHDLHMYDPDD